jgi:hypothetical protein
MSCLPFVHAASSFKQRKKDIACLMLPSCMTRTRVLLAVCIKVSALQLIAEAVKCKSDRCGTRVQGFDISGRWGSMLCIDIGGYQFFR